MNTFTLKLNEISYEQLENLLSTATYDNSSLAVYPKDKEQYRQAIGSCIEAKWASVLISDGALVFCDMYADGELTGQYTDDATVDGDGVAHYPITLNNIIERLNLCLEKPEDCGCETLYKKILRWMLGDSDFDMYDAYTIVQCFVFGEEIYG